MFSQSFYIENSRFVFLFWKNFLVKEAFFKNKYDKTQGKKYRTQPVFQNQTVADKK